MKDLKSTELHFIENEYGWAADIFMGEKSSIDTDICTVWGATKEELQFRIAMISKSPEMLEALKGIYRLRNIILPPADDVKPEHQDEVMVIYQAIKEIKSIIEELEQ